jgi:hypothetical protein
MDIGERPRIGEIGKWPSPKKLGIKIAHPTLLQRKQRVGVANCGGGRRIGAI